MTKLFEELAYAPTAMGDLTLRRRRVLKLGVDVLEVKLGEEFLMSSLFTTGERALATLGLAATTKADLNVVVGGLGLGYTAAAALDDPRVRDLTVIEALSPVIDWHRTGLVPLGARLTGDRRCAFQLGDFFAFAQQGPEASAYDVILLDIDHSPRALLHDQHGGFYSREGLQRLVGRLTPGGVFAMWSDARPDPDFQAAMAAVFPTCRAEVVEFPNPLQENLASCTIYIGSLAG